jgi:hypothetical protein
MPSKSKARISESMGSHLGPRMEKRAPQFARQTPNIGEMSPNVDDAKLVKFENNVPFFVVEKPKSPTENPSMLVFKSDPFMFAKQVIAGLTPEEVYGFFLDEDEAFSIAHDLVSSAFESAKSLEEKKEAVLGKLDKHINKLQREINQHMKEASVDPDAADRHHQMAEMKMSTIKELRNKHKMVGASKKELIKPEEDK